MSNNHDDMKNLMTILNEGRSIKDERTNVTETVITEANGEAAEAIEELRAIGYEIESLVYQAGEILGDVAASNPEAGMILKRAEAYWMAHIRGAVAFESMSSSMTSMAETIEELEELSGGAADPDPEGLDRHGDREMKGFSGE